MTETWTAYEAAYQTMRPGMKAFMDTLAAEFNAETYESTDGDDYGYGCEILWNGLKYFAELQLWDASDAGDEKPGIKGNIHFSICRDGGLIVVSAAPYNYTDECWVSYQDTEELCDRVPEADNAHEYAALIREDSERQDLDENMEQPT